MRLPLAESLLVATLAPLVLLTGGAWVRWVSTWLQAPPGVNEDDKKLLAQADSVGNVTALDRAQADERAARQFARGVFTATPPVAAADPFTDAASLWQARVDVARAAAAFPAKPYETWRTGGREAVEAALRHLKSGPRGLVADRVIARLESTITAVTDGWAKRADDFERSRSLRERLEVLLNSAERTVADPDACRRTLSEAKPLLDADPARKPRWDALSLRCEFHADWKNLDMAQFSPEQARKVRAFVERYEGRAGLTDAEATLLERARHRRTENAQREVIEQLRRGAADDPARFAEGLQTLRVDELMDGPRDLLRKYVRGWLVDHVPALPVPADWKKRVGDSDIELQQAERKGDLLVGVWRPGASANSFKYWIGIASYVIDQKGGVNYQAGIDGHFGIKAEPARWVGFRWIEDYNAARKAVAEKPDDREAWVKFADACERLAKETADHEKAHGRPNATWDFPFAARARFARALMDSTTWDTVSRCAK